ncbi:Gfo/Idh/MocA family protein [Dysosmobacter sp.]|uniref:Gfo/Idh/MocA family protein n=1 Tax=Dysosmobacter sp. TaxID=2591382 RepID=UPI002A85DEFD|nr:Gfo/Idh/MocA family oxidoreductase [Dysosmobacter sp.]MDY3282186.1 Gfo/Idh/MocA family oxidoreductase [Dysosmobacter sp.]
MNKVKMAIVGAGIWGENHARIYNAHPFAETVALCDMNLERAREVADRLNIPQVYSDYNEMFEKSGCDAVAVVTPDFLHADVAVAAAEHKKHILIEKPLATTAEDVHRMVKAIRENNVRAMVDLHNRWSPPFNAAHEAIQRGDLGEVYSAYIRLNDIKWVATDMLRWASKSSILWFLGSHSLDTLRWMFNDEVKRVYSVSRSGLLKSQGVDTVDEYLTTIEFRNGGIAQMENGWITPNANPCVNDIKFNVLGTKGMIALDVSNHNLIQMYTDDKVTVPDVLVQNHIFGNPKGFAFESIRSFVDCLLTGEPFHVSLEDAANTSLAILAIMESAEKRMPVDVELPY